MTGWPVPTNYPITTPYGKRGHSWSCNANSSGGVHTGVDFACPSNTNLYATIAGTIRHRSYGSAFGDRAFSISPSAGQPFANGEVFYAHGNERLPDGTEVQVGDYVGKSGARGNVSGPHLHYEFHSDTKNQWSCSVHDDPAPTLSTSPSGGGGGGGSSDGPFVTADVYSNKMGYDEPTNGDSDSDSVKELQNRLNRISLVGGQTLAISGRYDDDTDEEVRLWQEQVVHDPPDPPGQSYLGPNQFAAMFPSPPYTRHDVGLPAIATGGGSDGGSGGSGGSGGGGSDLPGAPALMLPGAVWNPITNFPGLRPFTGSAKKVTLHTTETSAKPNWEAQQSGIPHLTVDLSTGQRWQHLEFDIAAYTLSGGDNSPNSASGVNIQIEIIGYTRDCPTWSQARYDELGDILHWLTQNLGIPYDFPFSFTSPVRKNWTEWERQSGILGHVHAPYNNHTDPTGLQVERLVWTTEPEPEPEPPQPEPEPPKEEYVTKAEFDTFRNEVASVLQALVDLIEP